MQTRPITSRPYYGRRGFETVPTGRLATSLDEYKQLRDHEQTAVGLRAYAAACVREIRQELRRRGGRKAVPA